MVDWGAGSEMTGLLVKDSNILAAHKEDYRWRTFLLFEEKDEYKTANVLFLGDLCLRYL